MRYFIDTEFIEDSKTIDLLSIGIVAEDGREYYAQSAECDLHKANVWLWKHVIPGLVVCPYTEHYILESAVFEHSRVGQCTATQHLGRKSDNYATQMIKAGRYQPCPWRTREQLVGEVINFIPASDKEPEFWGWYADYDWVALCQLFGSMTKLPSGWPMYCRDLKQWCDMLGNPKLPEQSEGEHNALSDARHNLVRYKFLDEHTIDKILR